MNTIAKYFNTLKYLKFSQFYTRFIFKFTNPKVSLEDWKIRELEDWKNKGFVNKVSFPKVKDVLLEKNNFKFLNEERIIAEDWKIGGLEEWKQQKTNTLDCHADKSVRNDNNKNTEKNNDDKIINGWNDKNINKLWLYNLHYFDFLRQENITYEQSLFWIEKWIDENKIGFGNGWEPYTLSLRIVNWIKFYLAGNKLTDKIIQSLALQTEFLSKKLEYHLLANHLLANAKALVFAGLFFATGSCKKQKIGRLEDWQKQMYGSIEELMDRGLMETTRTTEDLKIRGLEDWKRQKTTTNNEIPHQVRDDKRENLRQAQDKKIRKWAKKWLEKGIEIYNKQLPEQILNDGGHFERSAMYHSIILEDLLDLKNISAPLELDTYIQKMINWLSVMTGPDGKISLFNDAAFGIALEPKEIFKYAEQLGFKLNKHENSYDLVDTGYARLQNKDWTLICDGAALGPDYQLGHSHADSLTFELWYKNERIICDTGTKQYFYSDIRKYQRGTSAHNTIVIDGKNSSEVWSAHRVAKRAKIIERNFGTNTFSATHNGYKPILHRRTWKLNEDGIVIEDNLMVEDWKIRGLEEWKRQRHLSATPTSSVRNDNKKHIVEMFFHIHPNYDVDIKDGIVKIFNDANTFNIKVDKDMKIFVTDGTVSFEFGKEEKNKIVCFMKTVALPFSIKTKIFAKQKFEV